MSVDTPRSQTKTATDTPRVAFSRSTAILLGAYIAQYRERYDFTLADLCEGQRIDHLGKPKQASDFTTSEWLIAIEKGQIALTEKMLKSIATLLVAAALNRGLNDFPPPPIYETAIALEQYPFGPVAMQLRQTVNASGPAMEEQPNELSDNTPADIRGTIDSGRQLLVLAPALVLATVAVIVLRFGWAMIAEHHGSWLDPVRDVAPVVKSVSWAIVILGVSTVAFAVSMADRVLTFGTYLAHRLRGGDREEALRTIDRLLKARGISLIQELDVNAAPPRYHTDLDLSPSMEPNQGGSDKVGPSTPEPELRLQLGPITPYLIPKYRARVALGSMRAQLYERLEAALLLSLLVSTATLCFSWALAASAPYGLLLFAFTAVLGVLFWWTGTDATAESWLCARQVNRGLGRLDTVEPEISRSDRRKANTVSRAD